jgi:hypothetical protein
MENTRREDLVAEIERYLAAVAIFRAEGREPRWRLESSKRGRRQRDSVPLKRLLETH